MIDEAGGAIIKLNGIEYFAAEIPIAARKPILDVVKAKFAKYVNDYSDSYLPTTPTTPSSP